MNRFSQRPTTWADLDAGYREDTMEVARSVAGAVRVALPGCHEQVKGALKMGYVDFWTDDPMEVVARVSPGDDVVRLYLHHITRDASGVLKVEGTGKGARHVKIQEPLNGAAVTALVTQALAAYQA